MLSKSLYFGPFNLKSHDQLAPEVCWLLDEECSIICYNRATRVRIPVPFDLKSCEGYLLGIVNICLKSNGCQLFARYWADSPTYTNKYVPSFIWLKLAPRTASKFTWFTFYKPIRYLLLKVIWSLIGRRKYEFVDEVVLGNRWQEIMTRHFTQTLIKQTHG